MHCSCNANWNLATLEAEHWRLFGKAIGQRSHQVCTLGVELECIGGDNIVYNNLPLKRYFYFYVTTP